MPSGNWFYDYQTLIVGVIGFGGVIITLVYNAHATAEEARQRRRHETNAVRVALLEELRALAKAMSLRMKGMDPAEGVASIALSMEPMDLVYKSHVGRIGLLSSAQIEKVLHAYGCFENYERRVVEFAARFPQPPPVPGFEVVQVPIAADAHMQALAKGVFEPVEDAIKSLTSDTQH